MGCAMRLIPERQYAKVIYPYQDRVDWVVTKRLYTDKRQESALFIAVMGISLALVHISMMDKQVVRKQKWPNNWLRNMGLFVD
jgi:hypothetical protein